MDGHNIKTLQLSWLRGKIGLVNQEPALFATSILENILYGKEGASAAEVIAMAKASNAHAFIDKLPQRYEDDRSTCVFSTLCTQGRTLTLGIFYCLGDKKRSINSLFLMKCFAIYVK